VGSHPLSTSICAAITGAGNVAHIAPAVSIQRTHAGCGTAALFLASRAWVYHEAILWGIAFSLAAFGAILTWIERPRWWVLALAALFTALAVGSRLTVAIGPVVALWEIFRLIPSDGAEWVALYVMAPALVLIVAVGLMIGSVPFLLGLGAGAEQFLGWKAGDVLGRGIFQLSERRNLRDSCFAGAVESTSAGEPWEGEIDLIRKDRKVICALVRASPFVSPRIQSRIGPPNRTLARFGTHPFSGPGENLNPACSGLARSDVYIDARTRSRVLSSRQLSWHSSCPSYCQAVVVNADVEACAINAGKINCHGVFAGAFLNVSSRIPIRTFNFIARLGVSSSSLRGVLE